MAVRILLALAVVAIFCGCGQNGKIVFDHSVVNTTAGGLPPVHDIWTVNPNGSNRAQLTTSSRRSEEAPAWSPAGRRIAFVSDDKLYVINPDGSNKIELPLPKGARPYEPTWSPDGDRIAFWDRIKGGLYMTHTDGSGTLMELSTPGLPEGAVSLATSFGSWGPTPLPPQPPLVAPSAHVEGGSGRP